MNHQPSDEEGGLNELKARLAAYEREIAELRALQLQSLARAKGLQAATTALISDLHFESLLPEILAYMEQVVAYDSASLFLREKDSLLLAAARRLPDPGSVGQRFPLDGQLFQEIWMTRRPVIIEDARSDPRFLGWGDTGTVRGWMGVPMIARDDFIGYLTLDSSRASAYQAPDATLVQAFANQAAAAIENARLFEQVRIGRERLQRLSRQLLEVQENERRRISLDLHDQIGQTLTAVKINLQAMPRLPSEEAMAERLERNIAIVERALQQVRDLSLDLRPSMLDDLGLVAALRWYLDRQAQQAGFAAELQADWLEGRPDSGVETACFRVAQEAITNIIRHAGASQVNVSLAGGADVLEMTVEDDGRGFDVAAALARASRGESLGLLGMQERVQLLGGILDISSIPGQGSRLLARFPGDPSQPLERRIGRRRAL